MGTCCELPIETLSMILTTCLATGAAAHSHGLLSFLYTCLHDVPDNLPTFLLSSWSCALSLQHWIAKRHELKKEAEQKRQIEDSTQEVTWSPQVATLMRTKQAECAVCLFDFEDQDRIRVLQCEHAFHAECVDQWLG